MSDIEDLEVHVKNLDFNRDGPYFHGLVRNLANLLGFKTKEHWFEADPFNGEPSARFVTLLDLRLVESMSYFKNYAYRVKHIRNQEYLISTTNHSTFEHLESGLYTARSVMANSTLGLEKRVLQYDQVRREFPPTHKRDSLALAFDNDYVVQLEKHFFLHPRFLYELVKKE